MVLTIIPSIMCNVKVLLAFNVFLLAVASNIGMGVMAHEAKLNVRVLAKPGKPRPSSPNYFPPRFPPTLTPTISPTPEPSPPLAMRDWTPFYVTFYNDGSDNKMDVVDAEMMNSLKRATEEYFDAFINDRSIAEGEFFRSIEVTISIIDSRRRLRRRNRRRTRELNETSEGGQTLEITGVVAFDPVGVPPPIRMDELRDEAFLGVEYSNALEKEGVYGNNVRAIISSTDPRDNINNSPDNKGEGANGQQDNQVSETEIVNATDNVNTNQSKNVVNTIVPILVVLIAGSIAALLFVQYKRRKVVREGKLSSSRGTSSAKNENDEYSMPHVIIEEGGEGGVGTSSAAGGESSGFELMSPSMTTTYSIQDSWYQNRNKSTISRSRRSIGTTDDHDDLDAYSLDGSSGLGQTPNQGDRMLGQVLAMGEYIPANRLDLEGSGHHVDASAEYSDAAASRKPALIRVVSTLSSNHHGEEDDPSVFTYSNDYCYDQETTSVLGGESLGGNSMMSETLSVYGRKMTIGDTHAMQRQLGHNRVVSDLNSIDGTSTNGIEIMVDNENGEYDAHNGPANQDTLDDTPNLDAENVGVVEDMISPLTLATMASPQGTVSGHQLSFSVAGGVDFDDDDDDDDDNIVAHDLPTPPQSAIAKGPTFVKVSKIVETEKTSDLLVHKKDPIEPLPMTKVVTAREEPFERTYSQFQRGPTPEHYRPTSQSHRVQGNKITVTSANSSHHTKVERYPMQSATAASTGSRKPLSKFRVMQINDYTSSRHALADDCSYDSYSTYENGESNSDADSAIDLLRNANNANEVKTPSPRPPITNTKTGSTNFRNKSKNIATRSTFPLQRVTPPSSGLEQKKTPYRGDVAPNSIAKEKGISTTNYAAVARRNRLNRMANTRNQAAMSGGSEEGGTGKESLSNQVASLRRARLQQRRA